MKKTSTILIALVSIALLAVFTQTNAVEQKPAAELEKSIAWYAANLKEAKLQNQQCHNQPELQSPANCANALKALQISFAVRN